MSVTEEYVLWSHYTDIPPPERPRSLMVGVALLIAALVRLAAPIRPSGLDGFFGLALLAGTWLVLLHVLKERRRKILRVWTDPGRPGVVLVRGVDGAVRKLNPARVRKIRLVRTSGSYQNERPGELGTWHSYLLVRMAFRIGLTWYTTRQQSLPDSGDTRGEQPSWSETLRRLAVTFPNARISERHVQLSGQEGFD
jgi:hypothetical protein